MKIREVVKYVEEVIEEEKDLYVVYVSGKCGVTKLTSKTPIEVKEQRVE